MRRQPRTGGIRTGPADLRERLRHGPGGRAVEGTLRPSSGTETHLELYRRFPEIGSIVHTHSPWATIWAQLGRDIPPLGTTHADDFGAQILCTRAMEPEKIEGPYERNTGRVIAETLEGWEFRRHSGVLVRGHGPFVWESMPEKAVEKAVVLERVDGMACALDAGTAPISQTLLDRHFLRKHGENAYYG